MEKTIFLFRRHKARSPDNFAAHYIGNHAPLGARLTRCLRGYTVNIVDGEGGPDAITEHWVDRASDLLTPEIAYATTADFQAVVADDRSLFDGMAELYVAVEEIVHGGAPLDVPLAAPTPETKVVWFFADADAAPPIPAAARRVVDNRIGYRLVFTERGREKVASEIGLIRMAWGPGLPGSGPDLAKGTVVREYRFIAAPG
jgi:hypothetical protein